MRLPQPPRQGTRTLHRLSNRIPILATVLLAAELSSACRSAVGDTYAGEVIVYVAVPLGGERAEAGQSALGGARLAVEEINQEGGLLGRRVVVRAMGDRSDSDTALAIAREIGQAIERGERIAGVVGHLDGGPAMSALPHYDEMGLVLISPGAGIRALTHIGYSLIFRVNANSSVRAAHSAQFLVEQLKARRVAVVGASSEYGREMADLMANSLRELGATPGTVFEVEEGERDFSHLAIQIREAEAKAVYFAGPASEAYSLVSSLKAAKLSVPMLASDGAFLASFTDGADGSPDGLYVSALARSPDRVAEVDWIASYRAVVRRDPGPFSISGSVAMQVLAAGVRAANSFQGKEVGKAIGEAGAETQFGPMRFSANGDWVDARIWIYRVEAGALRQLD